MSRLHSCLGYIQDFKTQIKNNIQSLCRDSSVETSMEATTLFWVQGSGLKCRNDWMDNQMEKKMENEWKLGLCRNLWEVTRMVFRVDVSGPPAPLSMDHRVTYSPSSGLQLYITRHPTSTQNKHRKQTLSRAKHPDMSRVEASGQSIIYEHFSQASAIHNEICTSNRCDKAHAV